MIENILLPYSQKEKRYFTNKKLGEGSFGAVYVGYSIEDSKQKKPLAIKISTLEKNNQQLDAIQTEAENLQQLTFPHTARYYDHCLNSQLPYLVREFLPQTLADRIKKNQVTQKLIIKYISQMAIFLSFLNHKGKIHNDLKCENIGYSSSEGIKILDMGHLETPGYKDIKKVIYHAIYAPEFSKESLLTTKSDIYTVGKSLQYLLTDNYELKTEEALDLIELIYEVDLPDTFKQLLSRMTLENPEKRINHYDLVALSFDVTRDLNEKKYFTTDAFKMLFVHGKFISIDTNQYHL